MPKKYCLTQKSIILLSKKGKSTGEVGNILYRYNKDNYYLLFTYDREKNLALLNIDSKIKTILLFSAGMCGISQDDLFNIDGLKQGETLTLFAVLKIIANIYNSQKKEHHNL